ncbi:Coiled-coil domain-containing protein 12 [Monoraphidium neglectum]|uniref:Coiled-coil domain-containing protein 12 n=1 Tax=Monoraphidium neglectum TaxID=145388 RepID=A0A0D2JN58_9CHLO|nr:Coiled-coil domain-containing protein 12 [Monoraphidium neglectum]KIZ00598.1 Coiled-coil domain-containing protein 12 [Monoraphidium neglectum]|eukprot:XP_013899617.1 Coiled-coil domain-containing protein 12 [Monoraphidium neglectum]
MEEAAARRERLKALKAAAALAGDGAAGDAGPAGEEHEQQEPEKPVLKFRNYVVKDSKHIEHEQVAPAQVPKAEEPVVEQRPEDAGEEELLASVAPKKANWDLKREVQPKLDKLERRTLRALVEIMQQEERRRIEEEGGVAD